VRVEHPKVGDRVIIRSMPAVGANGWSCRDRLFSPPEGRTAANGDAGSNPPRRFYSSTKASDLKPCAPDRPETRLQVSGRSLIAIAKARGMRRSISCVARALPELQASAAGTSVVVVDEAARSTRYAARRETVACVAIDVRECGQGAAHDRRATQREGIFVVYAYMGGGRSRSPR